MLYKKNTINKKEKLLMVEDATENRNKAMLSVLLPVKAQRVDLMKEFGSNFWDLKKNSLFFKYLAK